MSRPRGICFYQNELQNQIDQIEYTIDIDDQYMEWRSADSLKEGDLPYDYGIFYWVGCTPISNYSIPAIGIIVVVVIGSAGPTTSELITQCFSPSSKIGFVEINTLSDAHLFTRSFVNLINGGGIIGVDVTDVLKMFPVGISILKYSQATNIAELATSTALELLVNANGLPCNNLICTVFFGQNSSLNDITAVHDKFEFVDINDSFIIGAYVDSDLDASAQGVVHVDMISFL